MKTIFEYSRFTWNHSLDAQTQSNIKLNLKCPTVGYYRANKYAHIHYDTESFGEKEYSEFIKNPKAEDFIKNGILAILKEYEWKPHVGIWFLGDIKGLSPNEVKEIAEKIYSLLVDFGNKFIDKSQVY